MELSQLEQLIRDHSPKIVLSSLMVLGALVVLGYVYVSLTPTQKDDSWVREIEDHAIFGAILRFLVKFSPIQRK